MVNLVFSVFGQHLDLLVPTRLVAGTLNATTAEFNFHSPEWDAVEKTAYFKNYDTDDELSFSLIDDAIGVGRGLDFTPGVWCAYLVGEKESGEGSPQRITTWSSTFKVVAPE